MVNCCTDLAEIVSAFGQCHPPHFGSKLDFTRHLAEQPSEILSPQYDNRLLQRDIFMVTAPSMAVYALPFGTVYALNLIPDKETCTDNWSEAMQVEHHLGETKNRQILPPMPTRCYDAYQLL